METSTAEKGSEVQVKPPKQYYHAFYALNGDGLTPSKTNLPGNFETDVRKVLSTRLEKDQVFSGFGAFITIEQSQSADPGLEDSKNPDKSGEDIVKKSICYYYGQPESSESKTVKFIICFLCEGEEPLELFRSELDQYVQELLSTVTTDQLLVSSLPQSVSHMLETWYVVTIEYLARCVQALKENLKYLIHSALLDNKLVTSGGTTELQSDIQRFFKACSLSDILNQMRESRQESSSLGGSVDMLLDMSSATADVQGTITVSMSADSVKLDATGCNRYCEEWANALNRPDFQTPAKLRQLIEAFKLKFIQTMNNLKRLLREAESDYYALYRSYNFLRDSGNSDILLHYVMAETGNSNCVLSVLQEFMQEQQQQQQQVS